MKLDAGQYSNCALLSNGAVDCWGANSLGQLGLASIRSPTSISPVLLPPGLYGERMRDYA